MQIPKDVLQSTTADLLGGDVTGFDLERLWHLITITQHATNLLLNEIERRGELTVMPEDGTPIVPYMSDYMVETILTR